jgi:peroxiredoxin Q/BCP
MKHLKVGDAAPSFTATNQDGDIVSSENLKGQKLVLFFYPKDDTPGCTSEACNLRDNYRTFEKQGYKILGVSPDTEKKHRKFIDKYEFQYDLISDTDKAVLTAFGVWGPKTFMGRTYEGVHRTTFLIDENWKISGVIEKVKTKDHSNQIFALLDGERA